MCYEFRLYSGIYFESPVVLVENRVDSYRKKKQKESLTLFGVELENLIIHPLGVK